MEEHGGREGAGKAAVEFDHHLSDAEFGGPGFPAIRGEAGVLADGRLNAGAVEDFAFDLGKW